MSDPQPDCPFCAPQPDRIFHKGRLTLGLWDMFPVNPGHALLVTRRHVATWFGAAADEQAELAAGIETARREIERSHTSESYNVGINIGAASARPSFISTCT